MTKMKKFVRVEEVQITFYIGLFKSQPREDFDCLMYEVLNESIEGFFDLDTAIGHSVIVNFQGDPPKAKVDFVLDSILLKYQEEITNWYTSGKDSRFIHEAFLCPKK